MEVISPSSRTVVDINLPSCAFQPLSGKIYSYFNVKWTFLVFFAIFEVGSVVCGAAVSSTMLIVGRAVAGLGGSGLLNGGYTMIALAVPVEKQAGKGFNSRGRGGHRLIKEELQATEAS
jgi:MFS family permease